VRTLGINLGKLKFWQTRLATYVAMVNFVMIFYLYIIEAPLGLLWYHWVLIIVVGVVGTIIFDTVLVLPGSLEYQFIKNPEWRKLKAEIQTIKEQQEKILKRL